WLQLIVCIQAANVFSPCFTSTCVASAGQPHIVRQVDHASFRQVQTIEDTVGFCLGRPIIDNNDLQVLQRLSKDTLDGFFYKLPVVITGDDNADKWDVSGPQRERSNSQWGIALQQSPKKSCKKRTPGRNHGYDAPTGARLR